VLSIKIVYLFGWRHEISHSTYGLSCDCWSACFKRRHIQDRQSKIWKKHLPHPNDFTMLRWWQVHTEFTLS